MTSTHANPLAADRTRRNRQRDTPTPEPTAQSHAARTLAVAAAGTLLVTAVFSAAVPMISDSTSAVHAGVAGATWTLSGMSLGLAAALLTVGALADDFGRRRVLVASSAVLAAAGAPEQLRLRSSCWSPLACCRASPVRGC